jgi:hypothetical protein
MGSDRLSAVEQDFYMMVNTVNWLQPEGVMKMNKLRVLLVTMAVLALLSACQQDASVQTFDKGPVAEPPEVAFKDFGDHVLHFNSIPTSQLEAGVARQYNISRSKSRALLTVSIIRKEEGTPGVSVPGEVTATANNLTGQLKDLSLREIKEGDSYYYIGDVSVANNETLVFNINATPENEANSLSVRFMRQFYTN